MAEPSLAVTVLGSGGPLVPVRPPHRASSGYLIRVSGAPRVLIDCGGGTFVRMGEAGVDVAALDAVLLTHTHIDHSGELAPVVFATYLAGRRRPLPVVGPSGRDGQPGCEELCELLFGQRGAWRELHSFDGFGIQAHEVAQDATVPVAVPMEAGMDDIEIRAVGVAHGMMPAVAYRVDHGGHSVVVSGDVEGWSPPLVALARNCDVLVHDQALPRRDMEHGHLHSPPEETGANAAAAGARIFLLSHLMPPAEEALDDVLAAVATRFTGSVEVATDGCTVVAG